MIDKNLVDMYEDLYGKPKKEPANSKPVSGAGQNPVSGSGQTPATGSGQTPVTGNGKTPEFGAVPDPITGTGRTTDTTAGQSTQTEQQTAAQPAEEEKDPMEELDSLIGLSAIKHDVKELMSYAKVQKLREENGLKTVPVSLHLVFTGNPGTGKTTVARIISKLYKQIGILSKGQLVEVDRSGLVAGYVGQTAIKTQKKIEEAMGGILFIDEAYALAKSEENDYGQEAIDTILKAMEDNRSDFVVIVAGYTEPMKRFIESNPGLKSRFNKYIEFADYTMQELTEIFKSFCSKYEYEIDDENLERVTNILRLKKIETFENFANAREVRNLFEKIITNQARRIDAMENPTVEDMRTIVYEDLFDEEEIKTSKEAEGEATDVEGIDTEGIDAEALDAEEIDTEEIEDGALEDEDIDDEMPDTEDIDTEMPDAEDIDTEE